MPRNFKVVVSKLALPKIVIPQVATLTDPKLAVRICLGVLLAANLVAAGFAFHVFDQSPEALNGELASALTSRQTEQARLVRSRVLAANIDKGKVEGERFLASYMTSRRVTYSTILSELTEAAKAAGMDKPGATISPLDPIQGSDDLDMMSISLNLEGTYPQLMKFVNLLDRSQRFLLIETLTVTPRAKTDILTVNVKLDTFVKDDKDGLS
jgi:type IV pilus assembly protein PilO